MRQVVVLLLLMGGLLGSVAWGGPCLPNKCKTMSDCSLGEICVGGTKGGDGAVCPGSCRSP